MHTSYENRKPYSTPYAYLRPDASMKTLKLYTYVCKWCRYAWQSSFPLSVQQVRGCPACGRGFMIQMAS